MGKTRLQDQGGGGAWGRRGNNMGRVRTKTVKKASRVIIEKYYNRLTLDFHTNKRICEEVAIIQSKRLRNKISGFTTHLMKRIQRGPVRGISLKLQEEERERRMDFVPDESAVNTDNIRWTATSWRCCAPSTWPTCPACSSSPATRAASRVTRRLPGRPEAQPVVRCDG